MCARKNIIWKIFEIDDDVFERIIGKLGTEICSSITIIFSEQKLIIILSYGVSNSITKNDFLRKMCRIRLFWVSFEVKLC